MGEQHRCYICVIVSDKKRSNIGKVT